MEEWQIHEKHHHDILSIGPEDGLTRDSGQHRLGTIWKYNGPKVQAALKRLGHSSLGYETCSCKGKQ